MSANDALPGAIATSTIALLFSTTLISLRAFVKIFLRRSNRIEDFLCYLSWAGFLAFVGSLLYVAALGDSERGRALYWLNVMYCVYAPTMLAAKLSVLFQFKRLFGAPGRRDLVYWVIMVSIGVNCVVYTGLLLTYIFMCNPRQRIWDPSVPGRCFQPGWPHLNAGIPANASATVSNLVVSNINVVSDLEALLLPAWAIWHLKMPIKKKFEAFTVFAFGLIACLIAFTGLGLRVRDYFLYSVTCPLCSNVEFLMASEISVVIVIGCMPSMPLFYQHMRNILRRRNPSTLHSSMEVQNAMDESPPRVLGHRISRTGGNVQGKRTSDNQQNRFWAKYMGRGAIVNLTTLESRQRGEDEDGLRWNMAPMELSGLGTDPGLRLMDGSRDGFVTQPLEIQNSSTEGFLRAPGPSEEALNRDYLTR
ncbi:hypothetical protein F4778DRAFT_521793 [Xylariomycetidae sp. FL2044]|nr:hypothetical protein F4778DRAFT_521793 [Xylariomycetidae sp. FL2044]